MWSKHLEFLKEICHWGTAKLMSIFLLVFHFLLYFPKTLISAELKKKKKQSQTESGHILLLHIGEHWWRAVPSVI